MSKTVGAHTKLATSFCGIPMVSPIIAASGTFGNGVEYEDYMDLDAQVGAISMKGITPEGRFGNCGTRIAETPSGVLNCIGLENPGGDAFIHDVLPTMAHHTVPLIANISASSIKEFATLADKVSVPGVAAIEVNVSCPNVENEGMTFGIDPKVVESVTKAVKAVTTLPVIVKLSPNVTDIAEIARAVEAGGGDSVSLINTLLGMAINVRTRRPVLGNTYGGLSGPAVKPVALRMVHQVSQAVSIPIIGLGGIVSGTDVIEFMLAGASCVQVGTATMMNPAAIERINEEIVQYLDEFGYQSVEDLVGQLEAYA